MENLNVCSKCGYCSACNRGGEISMDSPEFLKRMLASNKAEPKKRKKKCVGS